MIPRLVAWIRLLSPRQRALLASAVAVVAAAVVSPFVWAGSPAYAGASARDFDEADRLLRECQDTLHDDSAETVLEWAMLRASMGDLDATAEPLRNAARQDPRLIPLVLEALTEGYLIMSRVLDALRSSDDWLKREPNNPQAWFVRGKIHRQVGASQLIAEDYQHVLDLDPDRSEARWWLARAQLDIGEYRKAYQNLETIHRERPNDPEVLVRLALCLQRLDQEADARALLDRVLAEHPDDGLALRIRGQMALADGQFDEAERLLRRAAESMPYDYKAQNALWDCLRQEGKSKDAELQRVRKEELFERRQRQADILTRLMSERPDDPALQCELADLYMHLGAPQVGEAWLLNVLRLDADYLPALEALAKYYRQRGDSDRAEAYRLQAERVKETKSHG
jgi:tetratricopeptide (TPR) repeat protein